MSRIIDTFNGALSGIEAVIGDTVIDPESLGTMYPGYRDYVPIESAPSIYVRNESLGSIEVQPDTEHIIFAVLAPSSTGKDSTIRAAFPYLTEQASFITTTTTRVARNGDDIAPNGEPAYQFISHDQFSSLIREHAFLENKPKGEHLYGTTIEAVNKSLQESRVSIWRGGLDGIADFRQQVTKIFPNVQVITVVILPTITIPNLLSRIIEKRGWGEPWRIRAAFEEIYQTPQHADFIILNPPDPSGIPQEAAENLAYLINSYIAALTEKKQAMEHN